MFALKFTKLMTNVAWAAGLFEGEGCFSAAIVKHKPRKSDGGISYVIYPRAQICMCDKDVLDRFCKTVGFGKVNGPYQPRGNRKPSYVWNATNRNAKKVIELLQPFMCERRQIQIKHAMAKCGRFDTKKGLSDGKPAESRSL